MAKVLIVNSEGKLEEFNLEVNVNYIGDLKDSLQPSDHDGWVLLDGRLTTSLTPTQQSNASSLGIGLNIPDAEGKVFKMDSTLLSEGGSDSVTLNQGNLPNVDFTGTTSSEGLHSHSYVDRGDSSINASLLGIGISAIADNTQSSYTTGSNGLHSHDVTISSGGSGDSIDIVNRYIGTNKFIYLGL